jgi:hypothetical protein
MKDNPQFEKDEALSRLLHTWKPEAQLPPRFQQSVWQRIERFEVTAKARIWQLLASRIEAAFARPALAAAYVALLLFAGIGAGYWHAEGRAAQAQSDLRERYVQSVDPYQMPR